MKRIIKFLIILFSFFSINVYAKSNIYLNLTDEKISYDGKNYTDIVKYDNLDDFLIDYNSNELDKVYITNFLFDGVSSVKSPDLDDIIDGEEIKTLDINVININTTGNIELSGKTEGTMIGINTNDVTGNINLILNNASIDTSSKKAPAIYVYNKDITYTKCKVTIKTVEDTKNYIEGGKLKKVSLIPSNKLDEYESYYSSESLENYKNYSSYYGIYNEEEVSNILFATVMADSEDLSSGDPYVFYKGSGAISSDIDLYFDGEGYLKVTSKNKEGIETKGNLTFSGGDGDYEIYAYDDCLNTTTSSSVDGARNDMVIDVDSLIAIVSEDADEGDAIDSNGTLTIKGGDIQAFASSSSADSGLDSSNGTYVNDGTIISTGNMSDSITCNEESIYVNLNTQVSKGSTVVIKDEDNDTIYTFTAINSFKTLFYSDDDLDYDSFKIYVDGENVSYSLVNNNVQNNNFNFILLMLIIEVSLSFVFSIYILIDKIIQRKRK